MFGAVEATNHDIELGSETSWRNPRSGPAECLLRAHRLPQFRGCAAPTISPLSDMEVITLIGVAIGATSAAATRTPTATAIILIPSVPGSLALQLRASNKAKAAAERLRE